MKKLFVLACLIVSSVFSLCQAEVRYTITDLGTLGGNFSVANGINDNGHVVGWSRTAAGSSSHAFLYDGTTMNDLGTLGGAESWAVDINDSGQVVGSSRITGNPLFSHAFLYDGTTMNDLGTLGGAEAEAYGINDSGQVVGESYLSLGAGAGEHAFVYDRSEGMLDLNSLIPSGSGWVLNKAEDINSSGQIVGSGVINRETHAYLMTPIPEPTTLLLLGMGVLVGRRRRRTLKA